MGRRKNLYATIILISAWRYDELYGDCFAPCAGGVGGISWTVVGEECDCPTGSRRNSLFWTYMWPQYCAPRLVDLEIQMTPCISWPQPLAYGIGGKTLELNLSLCTLYFFSIFFFFFPACFASCIKLSILRSHSHSPSVHFNFWSHSSALQSVIRFDRSTRIGLGCTLYGFGVRGLQKLYFMSTLVDIIPSTGWKKKQKQQQDTQT